MLVDTVLTIAIFVLIGCLIDIIIKLKDKNGK